MLFTGQIRTIISFQILKRGIYELDTKKVAICKTCLVIKALAVLLITCTALVLLLEEDTRALVKNRQLQLSSLDSVNLLDY